MDAARQQVHMTGSEWFATRPGGLNRYFESLFSALREHTDLRVSASAFGQPLPGGLSWGSPGGSLGSRVLRSRKGPSWNPDLIVNRHFSLYGSRPRTLFRSAAPLVVHFHGPWAAESRASGERRLLVDAKRMVETLRYAGADRYVVLSHSFKDVLCNDYRVDPDKVAVIPPGVNLERFNLTQTTRNRPMALCVRRLERRMGIDVLLRSWKSVTLAFPDAELTIVGTGSDESRLRALTAELGLEGCVNFVGRVPDDELANLYSLASFTVVPTLELEGFGLIALESLAAGRAPIVTDCGGLPDSVQTLDESLIVRRNDVNALTDRILDALDGKLPTTAQCRNHAEEFGWAKAAGRHKDLYNELA